MDHQQPKHNKANDKFVEEITTKVDDQHHAHNDEPVAGYLSYHIAQSKREFYEAVVLALCLIYVSVVAYYEDPRIEKLHSKATFFEHIKSFLRLPSTSIWALFTLSLIVQSFKSEKALGIVISVLCLPLILESKLFSFVNRNGHTDFPPGFICYSSIITGRLLTQTYQSLQSSLLFLFIVLLSRFRPRSRSISSLAPFFFFVVPFALEAFPSPPLDMSRHNFVTQLCLFMAFYSLFRRYFPRSFTLGEANLIAQILSIYITHTLHHRLIDDTDIVIFHAIIGTIIFGLVAVPITLTLRRTLGVKLATILFFTLFIATVYFALLRTQKHLHMNPLIWIWRKMTAETKTMIILGIWFAVLFCTLTVITVAHSIDALSKTVLRKLFHLQAIFIFLPGFIFQPQFTKLSLGFALSLFIFVEIIKIARVFPSAFLRSFMNRFEEEKDGGEIVTSHIYLLIGMGCGIFIDSEIPPFSPFAYYAGLLILGVGDSMASLIGSTLGRIRWPGTKKTLEGTFAAVLSICLVMLISSYCSFNFDDEESEWTINANPLFDSFDWSGFVLVTSLVSLLEAFTSQIDNLFLPLYYLPLLQMQATSSLPMILNELQRTISTSLAK